MLNSSLELPNTSTQAGGLIPFASHEVISSHELPSLNAGQIRLIHRGNDGYITLARKLEGERTPDGKPKWLELGGIQACNLEQMFPQFQDELTVDAYFPVNSMWGQSRGRQLKDGTWKPSLNPRTGLPQIKRGKTNLRYLNACFTDLDCHDKEFDYASLHADVIRAQDAGLIPPASIIVRSGRGAWILWLLRDMELIGPQRAFSEKVEQWCRIQRAIQQRLASVGADGNAIDPARVTRIPGSLNTAAKPGVRVVTYSIQADQYGQPFLYTLEELAEWFGVEKRSFVLSRTKAKHPEKRLGWLARWQYAWEDFWNLEALRIGFQKYHRTEALKIMISLGVRLGFSDKEIRGYADRLSKSFRPQYPRDRALQKTRELIQWTRSHPLLPLSNKKFAQGLGVTSQEEEVLGHWFKPPKNVESTADTRSRAIRELWGRLGRKPTVREGVTFLKQRGIKGCQGTVSYDLKAVALEAKNNPLSHSLSTLATETEHLLNNQSEKQRTDAEQRRETFKLLLIEHCGGFPPQLPLLDYRTFAEMLKDLGYPVSHVTVGADLKKMGVRAMTSMPPTHQQPLFDCTA